MPLLWPRVGLLANSTDTTCVCLAQAKGDRQPGLQILEPSAGTGGGQGGPQHGFPCGQLGRVLSVRGGQEEELEGLHFNAHQGFFFSLKLLVGDVSYSQRCLIMRKKELPFVHIQDF